MKLNESLLISFILLFSTTLIAQENTTKNPKRAAIYSAILPGFGQAYTKQYWKIPIIYGGLIASAYYTKENHNQYSLYKQTYLNRINNQGTDEFTNIYSDNELLTLTQHYRRNREISALLFTLTYILNIIDASVSAHLFDYNIHEDISLSIRPAYIANNTSGLSLSIKL